MDAAARPNGVAPPRAPRHNHGGRASEARARLHKATPRASVRAFAPFYRRNVAIWGAPEPTRGLRPRNSYIFSPVPVQSIIGRGRRRRVRRSGSRSRHFVIFVRFYLLRVHSCVWRSMRVPAQSFRPAAALSNLPPTLPDAGFRSSAIHLPRRDLHRGFHLFFQTCISSLFLFWRENCQHITFDGRPASEVCLCIAFESVDRFIQFFSKLRSYFELHNGKMRFIADYVVQF